MIESNIAVAAGIHLESDWITSSSFPDNTKMQLLKRVQRAIQFNFLLCSPIVRFIFIAERNRKQGELVWMGFHWKSSRMCEWKRSGCYLPHITVNQSIRWTRVRSDPSRTVGHRKSARRNGPPIDCIHRRFYCCPIKAREKTACP